MRQTRDSFLMFLQNNISNTIPIHAVRRDVSQPGTDKLQTNAINIKFLNSNFNNQVADQLVSLDVVHEDELTALDWTQQLWTLLSTQFYTPKYDFTNPASPVAQNNVIFWDGTIRFKPVAAPMYFHFHSRITLKHHLN